MERNDAPEHWSSMGRLSILRDGKLFLIFHMGKVEIFGAQRSQGEEIVETG